MTVSGTIDRTALSLSALAFGSGSSTGLSLFTGGLTFGRRQWRRQVAVSPYVKGEWETAAVLDQTHDTQLRWRVRAATETALQSACHDLIDAVEQITWDLTVTVNSVDWPTVTCTRADTEVLFDTAHIRGLVATVNVYTTHRPTGGLL